MHLLLRATAIGCVTSAALCATAATAWASATAPAPASVSVVHGLRGLTADVELDGEVVLEGFGAERATDPLPVPAGPHTVEVRRSGDTSGTPVVRGDVTLEAGASTTLVVHLDTAGEPRLSTFADDTSVVPAGQGRLVLRNTSSGASLQVLVDGAPLGGALASPAEATTVLPAGPHTVAVQAAGGGDALATQTVEVPAGSSTLLYLIGSPEQSDLGWLVQTVDGLGDLPFGVPTGTSGLKDGPAATASSAPLAGLAVLVTATALGTRLRQRR